MLVSNAGIVPKHSQPFRSEATADIKRLMDVNFFSGAILAKEAIPHLEKVGGNIVFTGSVVGLKVLPGLASYCMSKAPINILSKLIAIEEGPKVG